MVLLLCISVILGCPHIVGIYHVGTRLSLDCLFDTWPAQPCQWIGQSGHNLVSGLHKLVTTLLQPLQPCNNLDFLVWGGYCTFVLDSEGNLDSHLFAMQHVCVFWPGRSPFIPALL